MSQSKEIGRLIKNKLFTGINPLAIRMNLIQSNFLSFKEGDIIFKTGDKSDYFYLILDGEIKLKIINSINSSNVRVKENNDFFGDFELLDGSPRKSSAVANTDCILYRIFQKELLELSSAHKTIRESLAAEKNDNISIKKNTNYQIKQHSSESGDAVNPALTSEIDTLSQIQKEEPTGTPVDNIELDLPKPEEPPLNAGNSPLLNYEDGEFAEGSLFSAALNGDLIFPDEAILNEKNQEQAEFEVPIPDSQILNAPVPDKISPDENTSAQENIYSNISAPEVPESEVKNEAINFEKLFYANKKIHENTELDRTVHSIIEAILSVCDTQIARIFILETDADELWSFPFMDNSGEIKKVKIGEGLIGSCALSDEIINVLSPQKDERFNYRTDMVDNITVEDMLLFPVHNNSNKVRAVIQLINSGIGFGKEVVEILGLISSEINSVIERCLQKQKKVPDANLNRLEEYTEFIMEDIKTPLILIKRYSEFIRKKTGLKEVVQVSEFILEQVNSITAYSDIVSDFVNGRISVNKTPVNLQKTLNNILDMFAEYIEFRNAKLFKKLESDTEVLLDSGVFYHACFQIIKNICNSLPEGGNIYILSRREGNDAIIEFHGTGKLIDDEKINKSSISLGGRFDEENTNLGLAIADKIIKDHNGSILIHSESEEAISFVISLPVHSDLSN